MATGDQQRMTIAGLRKLSKDYTDNARRCQEIANFLNTQQGSLFWQSQGASSFKENMTEYVKKLKQFHDDFIELSKEVDNRANTLERSGNI